MESLNLSELLDVSKSESRSGDASNLGDAVNSEEVSTTTLLLSKNSYHFSFHTLNNIKKERINLIESIRSLKTQHDTLLHDMAALNADFDETSRLESSFWSDCTSYRYEIHQLQDDLDSKLTRREYFQSRIEKLEKANVLNDAFQIWHEGDFGTINGIRLGRTAAVQVPWTEVNSALGLVCLLASILGESTVAMVAGKETRHIQTAMAMLQKFKIHPRGRWSSIAVASSSSTLSESDDSEGFPLYYDYSLLNRPYSLDPGLVALLEYIQGIVQIMEWVGGHGRSQFRSMEPNTLYSQHQSQIRNEDTGGVGVGRGFGVPYKIQTPHVNSLTICLHSNSEENWSKALKCLLVDLKWCISWWGVWSSK